MRALPQRLSPLLAILLFSLLFQGCNTVLKGVLKEPEVSIEELKLVKAGLINQTFAIGLTITNPNPVPLPVKSLSYAIHLAGDEFARGDTLEPFNIPAGGSETVNITVKFNLLRSTSHLLNIVKSGVQDVNYQVAGSIGIDLPLMGAIPINKVGSIKLIR